MRTDYYFPYIGIGTAARFLYKITRFPDSHFLVANSNYLPLVQGRPRLLNGAVISQGDVPARASETTRGRAAGQVASDMGPFQESSKISGFAELFELGCSRV